MERKSKLVHVATALVITLAVVIGTLVAVLVVGNQSATSRVKVQYTSSDVWVRMEANYYVGSTGTALKDGSNTSIELSPINTSGSLNQVEDVVTLDKTNSKIVYEYIFTNLSDTIPAVISQTMVDSAVMVPTDTYNNVTLKYIASSTQLGANAGVTATETTLNSQALNPSATKYVYVVVEIKNLLYDVLFEGEFGWTLTKGTAVTTSTTNSSGNKIINVNTTETGLTNATELNNIQLVMGVENEEPSIYPQVLNKAFTGWYYDSELTNKVEWPAVITETTTLYPKTEESTSDLSYTFDSATNSYSIATYTGSATEIVIPDIYNDGTNGQANVTKIANEAFNKKTAITSVTIPNSVTSIGSYAFSGCFELMDITIPNGIKNIGGYAFYGCRKITTLIIPKDVISIGDNAFGYCVNLASIIVDSRNNIFDSRENCNAIIQTNTNTLVTGCQNTIIPTSVTGLGTHAFFGCSNLTSITIPSSVTSVGEVVFSYCNALISIVVDSKNPKYDSRDNCNAIIETATNTLISGCTTTIIPNSVTNIGNNAFLGLSSLKNITIPSSIVSIGRSAFSNCLGLTNITIPNSVTSISIQAFSFCSGLTSIIVDSGNAVYDSRDNCNAIIETATNSLIAGCQNTVIPNSVTSIGDSAFYGCFGLTNITIPISVTSIGWSAFNNCSGLTSITIPNSVTSIGYNAFYNCSKLTSVKFENTAGWWVADSSSATSGDSVTISATDLSANATLLTSTHVNKYWKKN